MFRYVVPTLFLAFPTAFGSLFSPIIFAWWSGRNCNSVDRPGGVLLHPMDRYTVPRKKVHANKLQCVRAHSSMVSIFSLYLSLCFQFRSEALHVTDGQMIIKVEQSGRFLFPPPPFVVLHSVMS